MRIGAQVVKAVTDGLGCHGLQPQSADRLAQGFSTARVLLDQAKDQFPFAARVTGVDDFVHILAFGQFDHGVQARPGLVHRLQIKVRWNHWQVGKAPFAAFDIEFFGGLDFHQVTHGAGYDIRVTLKVFVVLLEFADGGRECPHDVLSDGRLLGND